jgi:hypothetical protein
MTLSGRMATTPAPSHPWAIPSYSHNKTDGQSARLARADKNDDAYHALRGTATEVASGRQRSERLQWPTTNIAAPS